VLENKLVTRIIGLEGGRSVRTERITYWKTLYVVLSITHQQYEHVKGDKMGEACSRYCKDEAFTQILIGKHVKNKARGRFTRVLQG